MLNIIIWIGAIAGIIGVSIGIVLWERVENENVQRHLPWIINCSMIVYVVCAYIILKPLMLKYLNLEWRMAVGAEALILLFFILIARGIRVILYGKKNKEG